MRRDANDRHPLKRRLRFVPDNQRIFNGSPLLANIYMNRFLKQWRLSGCDKAFRAQLLLSLSTSTSACACVVFLVRRHKVAGRGNHQFSFDVLHWERRVLCLERLP